MEEGIDINDVWTWKCRKCRCTQMDCSQCIDAQGYPCEWVAPDLCSRCADGDIENDE